jgi:hypothetical protein
MPVNEFEKQVQQKMDELQLRPSGEVWEEVEKHIRKDKKRRRVIFWFFIFSAMLAGGSAWWLASGHKEQLADSDRLHQIQTEKTTNGSDSKSIPSTKEDKANIKEPVTATTNNSTQETIVSPEKITDTENTIPQKRISTTDATTADIEILASQRNKPVSAKSNRPVADKTIDQPTRENRVKQTDKAIDDNSALEIQQLNASKGTQQKPVVDTTARITQDDKSIVKDMVVSDVPVTKSESKQEPLTTNEIIPVDNDNARQKKPLAKNDKKPGKKNDNKLEWGITALAGTSQLSDNFALGDIFSGLKSADAFGPPQASPGTNFTGGPQSPVSPAQPGRGFAWQAGVYAKKKLSKRTGLSVGLDFSAFSTRQRTGILLYNNALIRNDAFTSAVSNYYSNGTAGVRTNRYYYLQVPVYFHWQLTKGEKLPVTWKNGLSFGRMVASDAVIYSNVSNVFYEDDKLFNKTQLSYQSGVYLKMFNRTAKPVTIGAVVNYHLSNLEKINTDKNNHLLSFGLQVGWIFKK